MQNSYLEMKISDRKKIAKCISIAPPFLFSCFSCLDKIE